MRDYFNFEWCIFIIASKKSIRTFKTYLSAEILIGAALPVVGVLIYPSDYQNWEHAIVIGAITFTSIFIVIWIWNIFFEPFRTWKKQKEEIKELRQKEIIDYEAWDDVYELRLAEVAHLWVEQSPSQGTQLTKQALPIHRILRTAIKNGDLYAIDVTGSPGGNTIYVSRDHLKEYAKQIGKRPKFLYPEER